MMPPTELGIESWKDCRKGERAVILGSGPSLDDIDPVMTLGYGRFALNLTILIEGYRDAHWVCRDGRCFRKWLRSSRYMGGDFRKAHTLITDHAGAMRVAQLGIDKEKVQRVVNTQKRFFTGETVLVFAMQVADYLGFDEIVLAGVDLCDPAGVAYAEKIDWQSKHTVSARPARHNRMRKELSVLASSLNAKVLTASPLIADMFDEVRL